MLVYVLMYLGAAETAFWAVDQARLFLLYQAILHEKVLVQLSFKVYFAVLAGRIRRIVLGLSTYFIRDEAALNTSVWLRADVHVEPVWNYVACCTSAGCCRGDQSWITTVTRQLAIGAAHAVYYLLQLAAFVFVTASLCHVSLLVRVLL